MSEEDDIQDKGLLYIRADLREVSSTGAGQRFLADLLESSGCLFPNDCKSADVYRQAAVQAFGWSIWRQLHAANPEASLAIFDELMKPVPQKEEQE